MEIRKLFCDGCAKDFSDACITETQEFLHWENIGGYGAPFGDGVKVTLDLCHDCQIKYLSDLVYFPDGK